MHFTTAALTTALLAVASAAPTQVQQRQAPRVPPTTISTFSSVAGLAFNTGIAHVSTDPSTIHQVSTLLTFSLPPDAAGKLCTLHFAPQAVSGSARLDLFTSLAPATPASTNNQRNNFLLREQASLAADLVPVDAASAQFPCPGAGPFGLELAPVSDADGNDDIVGSDISISFV